MNINDHNQNYITYCNVDHQGKKPPLFGGLQNIPCFTAVANTPGLLPERGAVHIAGPLKSWAGDGSWASPDWKTPKTHREKIMTLAPLAPQKTKM